jgi:hypothetical protein
MFTPTGERAKETGTFKQKNRKRVRPLKNSRVKLPPPPRGLRKRLVDLQNRAQNSNCWLFDKIAMQELKLNLWPHSDQLTIGHSQAKGKLD